MELYFSPSACSLAARIALDESGQPAVFREVVLSKKQPKDGGTYLPVNPRGQVPALRTDDGALITEVTAVLQYIAEQAPDSGLLPPPRTLERTRVQQWLSEIGTELHKAVFYLIFKPTAPEAARQYAGASIGPKYDGLVAYRERMLARPAVRRAVRDEMALRAA